MRALAGIFTQESNYDLFELCLAYFEESVEYARSMDAALAIDLNIREFSNDDSDKIKKISKTYEHPFWYTYSPGAGFCENMNEIRQIAINQRYDVIISINDDAIIHKQFIHEGIQFLRNNGNAGFVGGASQQGGWNTPLEMLSIPQPEDEVNEIRTFNRLWWEASACMYRTKAMKETGPLDSYFSPTGFCADSEYLMRLAMNGWSSWRNERMTFWHSKGASQSKFRIPVQGLPDPTKDRVYSYICMKWGVNPYNEEITSPKYNEPFDGKKCIVINETTLELDGQRIKII